MKMGIENGTIRLVIDTTNSRVYCMSVAAAPADSHQIPAIRRPALPLGVGPPVQGYPSLRFVPRSLSDIDRSTAVNDLQPSASFSALKNPQCISANTPPVSPGLRPRTWLHLLRLVTKVMSDRLLVGSRRKGSLPIGLKFPHSRSAKMVLSTAILDRLVHF